MKILSKGTEVLLLGIWEVFGIWEVLNLHVLLEQILNVQYQESLQLKW